MQLHIQLEGAGWLIGYLGDLLFNAFGISVVIIRQEENDIQLLDCLLIIQLGDLHFLLFGYLW